MLTSNELVLANDGFQTRWLVLLCQRLDQLSYEFISNLAKSNYYPQIFKLVVRSKENHYGRNQDLKETSGDSPVDSRPSLMELHH